MPKEKKKNQNPIFYPSFLPPSFLLSWTEISVMPLERVKERIKQDAIKQGIDPNKYCFDVDNVECGTVLSKELFENR